MVPATYWRQMVDRLRKWFDTHSSTVRFRATAAATLVVACALVLGSAVLVMLLRASLERNVGTAAELRAQDIAAAISNGSDLRQIPVRDEEDSFVQVIDPSGVVVLSSSNVEGEGPIAVLEPGDRATAESVPVGEGTDSFSVVAREVTTPEGPLLILVGGSLEQVSSTTADVAGYLGVGVPLLLLVVGFTTWHIAGRALRPVETIRSEVADISASEFARRVPVPATKDEIARLALTMNEMLDRLSDSHDRQRRFISDASHELRSPITTIRHQAEVAYAHPEGVEVRDLAESVLLENLRLEQLVEALLLIARADEQTLALTRRLVDLDDLALEEATRLRETTGLRIETAKVSAARVEGDAAMLRRSLRNLCNNAVRHARSVVSFDVRTSGDDAIIAVVDDGAGVPVGDRLRIFERFTRLEEARDRDSGGSGLGLAITSEIVAAHGGRIAVTDAPRGGARFEIVLPSKAP